MSPWTKASSLLILARTLVSPMRTRHIITLLFFSCLHRKDNDLPPPHAEIHLKYMCREKHAHKKKVKWAPIPVSTVQQRRDHFSMPRIPYLETQ